MLPGMIVSKIFGGLGNQMFQYAVGRSLALRHGVPLRLDLGYFAKTDGRRRYGLDHFALEAEPATAADIARTRGYGESRLARSWYAIARRVRGPSRTYHRDDRTNSFDPTFANWTSPAYLKGTWPDERYFSAHAQAIRDDFRVVTPPLARTTEVEDEIAASGRTASLHVRRGDFLSAANYDRFGELSPTWYGKAVDRLLADAPGARFFVFSDDIVWARANLTLPADAVFVDHTDESTCIDDLRLMSRCRHHIIPNSTFSWWGSWLGPTDGIVIAPQPMSPQDPQDLRSFCPPRWHRMPRC